MITTITTRRSRRRRVSAAGQDQLTRRLARRVGRNGILDPTVGKESDPRTQLRKAARALWKSYLRYVRRKDRCFALLRDAITHAEMIQFGDKIAELDVRLHEPSTSLDQIEDRLHPMTPTFSTEVPNADAP